MQQIKNYLDQIATISNTDWEFFTSKLQRREIPKKTVFLKLGAVENHISFIESGVVRLFIPKEDVIILDMKYEDAIKLIVSAGMVFPETSN